MKKLIIVGVMVISFGLSAQSPHETQYVAYLKASKTLWERSVEEAEKVHGKESFETALALYGLLNNTMATKDEEAFDKYKDETVDLLEALIDRNDNWGEPRAVLSSVYGLVMAYSPMKGMFLGMKSSSLMDDAVKLQSESALVQKLFAGSKLYTPEMWGGDPEKAKRAYEKSLSLFDVTSKVNNWLYLDTMMSLAMAYKKIGEDEKAVATLEKAIAIEPQYHWAKTTLEKWKS